MPVGAAGAAARCRGIRRQASHQDRRRRAGGHRRTSRQLLPSRGRSVVRAEGQGQGAGAKNTAAQAAVERATRKFALPLAPNRLPEAPLPNMRPCRRPCRAGSAQADHASAVSICGATIGRTRDMKSDLHGMF